MFKKGQTSNPSGRPKGTKKAASFAHLLSVYLQRKAVEEERDHWLQHVVDMAWDNPQLMTAIMKKLIPDKTELSGALTADLSGKITVEFVSADGNKC